ATNLTLFSKFMHRVFGLTQFSEVFLFTPVPVRRKILKLRAQAEIRNKKKAGHNANYDTASSLFL
ncbi:hypothetical protein, partial [Duncaniella muris]|uniref:hypothetical protein n=2 Tax=Duncaniella TaxID=2518495 RepID=UPI0025B6B93C